MFASGCRLPAGKNSKTKGKVNSCDYARRRIDPAFVPQSLLGAMHFRCELQREYTKNPMCFVTNLWRAQWQRRGGNNCVLLEQYVYFSPAVLYYLLLVFVYIQLVRALLLAIELARYRSRLCLDRCYQQPTVPRLAFAIPHGDSVGLHCAQAM